MMAPSKIMVVALLLTLVAGAAAVGGSNQTPGRVQAAGELAAATASTTGAEAAARRYSTADFPLLAQVYPMPAARPPVPVGAIAPNLLDPPPASSPSSSPAGAPTPSPSLDQGAHRSSASLMKKK
ncbi:hypothetical protein PVAP13_2KG363501 [Panicum virgatum]|uniref:Uncharacterized protein n=1 Tax=Panicum virgatum TaxID=38727 RepID=A0A8T0WGQ9_PANVG|nr:hypothetical protein PVAP13_2KG363501 [Panicum virgatum]